jgi:hypothetical protein
MKKMTALSEKLGITPIHDTAYLMAEQMAGDN